MILFNVELPAKAVPALDKLCHAYNAQTSQNLTLTEFITRNIRELSIAQELNDAVPPIQASVQERVQDEIAALRDRLLATQED